MLDPPVDKRLRAFPPAALEIVSAPLPVMLPDELIAPPPRPRLPDVNVIPVTPVKAPLEILSPLIVLVVLAVIVLASVNAPLLVNLLLDEKKLMSPVVLLPNCRVWLLVVASIPFPCSVVAPVDASPDETEAVGVPVLTFMNANLELVVAVLPINRSRVSLTGESAPELILQKLLPAGPEHPLHEATVRVAPLKLTFVAEVSVISPLLAIVNLGVPLLEAVKISPLVACLFMINAACPPALGETIKDPVPAFVPRVKLLFAKATEVAASSAIVSENCAKSSELAVILDAPIAIVVLVTAVTLPCASVVRTRSEDPDPYVFAAP